MYIKDKRTNRKYRANTKLNFNSFSNRLIKLNLTKPLLISYILFVPSYRVFCSSSINNYTKESL